MKLWLTIAALNCYMMAAIEAAQALDFERTAPSGRATRMHIYKSWNRDCEANGGVVKVVRKPKHGKLSHRAVQTEIGYARLRGFTRCTGTPIRGFQVDYQSNRGFRGVDTFVIEVTFGTRRRDVDTYFVDVH